MHTTKVLNERLFEAVKQGTLEEIREALIMGADINARDKWGCTPILRAAWRGDFDIFAFINNYPGVDREAANNVGWTSLMGAAMQGHDAIVVLIISTTNPEFIIVRDNDKLSAADKARNQGHNGTADFIEDMIVEYQLYKLKP